jgi:two-component system chemotaxis response regulator CheY
MKRVLVVDDEQDVKPLFQQRFRREIRQGMIDLAFSPSAEDALQRFECSVE